VLVGLGREKYRGCLNRTVVVVIGIEGMVLESAKEKDHRIGVVVGRDCFAAVEVWNSWVEGDKRLAGHILAEEDMRRLVGCSLAAEDSVVLAGRRLIVEGTGCLLRSNCCWTSCVFVF
jgi:hypothetical protein